jgi:hypothetical protein
MLTAKTKGELIKQLEDLFSVRNTTVYRRLNKLGIEPIKGEDGWSITDEALAELDKLDSWIADGNTLESYPTSSALAVKEDDGGEIEQETIRVTPVEEGNQLAQIIRNAAKKATGMLMAENVIAQEFLANPELLPDDLLEQVRATEEALTPKSIDPIQYANSLVSQFKSQLAA